MAMNLTVRSAEYPSVRAQAAKAVVRQTIDLHNDIFDLPGPQMPSEPPSTPDAPRSSLPICIVGAGCAGLYAAMILDTLGLKYEIVEAADRIGGRLYTHRFNGEAGRNAPINNPARYDYVDIGAMRYPNIPFMKRVFDLFERLKLQEDKLLIEYVYTAKNTLELYNGVRHNSADPATGDIFQVSEAKGGAVPNAWVARGVDNVTNAVFGPFAENFRTLPFGQAWAKLAAWDAYATRGILLTKMNYPETVVEWMETFGSATGLYNNAFVESTMDAMDFGSASAATDAGASQELKLDYDWYCIDGGSDHITTRMAKGLQTPPQTGIRVTRIASTLSGTMTVTSEPSRGGNAVTKHYSQVICTVPLGCLAAIEIPREDMSYMQRLAVRCLNYDTSTKVALKFRSRWWENPAVMNGRTIKGGVSSTDIPIRTCVYPSYGFNATGPAPGVMLASYTWAQDAQRFGGLAQSKGSLPDKRLVELTLQNLAALHGLPLSMLQNELVDHYAYNWHNDENARGAFALFGPGQFGQPSQENSMFASMKAPAAKGKLHIAGEATSVHHAWVLGALNSAWRAVYNALGQLDPTEARAKRALLEKLWGIPDEEETKSLLRLAVLAERKLL